MVVVSLLLNYLIRIMLSAESGRPLVTQAHTAHTDESKFTHTMAEDTQGIILKKASETEMFRFNEDMNFSSKMGDLKRRKKQMQKKLSGNTAYRTGETEPNDINLEFEKTD